MRSNPTGIHVKEYARLTEGFRGYSEQPVVASDGKGKCWVAWVSRLPQDKDVIFTSCYRETWDEPLALTEVSGKYDYPCIACDDDGHVMIAWVNSKEWVVESAVFNGEGFDSLAVISVGFGKARNPVLVSAPQGGFWIAWESYSEGRFRICLRGYSPSGWGETLVFGEDVGNSYNPALAWDEKGRIWVAYSAAEQNGTCIYLTHYDVNTRLKGGRIRIASYPYPSEGIPHMNSFPSVLCDSDGRVWVAWQHNGDGQELPCYFGLREISVVCWDGNRLWHVRASSPDYRGRIVFVRGEGTDYEAKVPRLWERNNYYPLLVKGVDGRIYLFSRNSLENPRNRKVWDIKVSALVPNVGWTKPVSLLQDGVLQGDIGYMGRGDRPAVAIADDSSLWLAWQGDNYLEDLQSVEEVVSDIHVAKVSLDIIEPFSSCPGNYADLSLEEYLSPEPPIMESKKVWGKRRKIGHEGREYTLLWGNLHDHTQISRCWQDSSNGTLDEKYRYGMDVEGYDFVALTDHGYDLYEARWRETRKAAEFYNDPPHFLAFPSFEWTRSGPDLPPSSGHRNIVFASDEDASKFLWNDIWVYHMRLPVSDRLDKVCNILREKHLNAVLIPHHPVDMYHPMDWAFHDPEFECAVEIYQCSGSAEYEGCPRQISAPTRHKGCYVRDALKRGYRLGFVASGDHNSMGMGITALFVTDISRDGIIEALKMRRCYATTGARIFVDFRVDGHFMGEEYYAKEKPHIVGVVEGVKPLRDIVVFRNDVIVYEKRNIGDPVMTVDFVDEDFSDDSYYYLRVIQEDNEIAWSSPVWVNRKT